MKRRKPWSKVTTARRKKLQAVDPTEVLLELVALLEDYAPTWYTKKQRDRAFAALRVLGVDLDDELTTKD